MQEGLANVCLVTASMTIVRAKLDVQIPRKRRGDASQHEKGLQKFYDQVIYFARTIFAAQFKKIFIKIYRKLKF